MPHFSTLFCSKPGAPKAHRFQADSPNYAEHIPFGATFYEISKDLKKLSVDLLGHIIA